MTSPRFVRHIGRYAAIDECERPDWLILLAWEALDHKAALRVGADAARILLGRSDALRLFTPAPDRLEPVELWADNVDSDARTFQNLRAIAAAAPMGGLVAFLLDRFVTSSVWGDSRYTMLSVTIVALNGRVRTGQQGRARGDRATPCRDSRRSGGAEGRPRRDRQGSCAQPRQDPARHAKHRRSRDETAEGSNRVSFAEIADQRHMTAAKPHLGELTWDVDPDPYQRLRASSDSEVGPFSAC